MLIVFSKYRRFSLVPSLFVLQVVATIALLGGACSCDNTGQSNLWDKTGPVPGLVAGAPHKARLGSTASTHKPTKKSVKKKDTGNSKRTIKQKCKSTYEQWEGVRLVKHNSNDGDSFRVSHQGKVHTIRLYFVDTPEKRQSKYNGKRLRYQADYFGASQQLILSVGKTAQKTTLDLLGKEPFTVYTSRMSVYDSDRIYGFVQLSDGTWLSEWLVRRGLARIYGQFEERPDCLSAKRYKKRLKGAEVVAKRKKLGAWASR